MTSQKGCTVKREIAEDRKEERLITGLHLKS